MSFGRLVPDHDGGRAEVDRRAALLQDPPRVHMPSTNFAAIGRMQEDCARRLERARLRALEFDADVSQWREKMPYAFDIEIDADRLGWGLRVIVEHEPDLASWGLTLGEALHHLRSVLNTTLVGIALAAGAGVSRNLQFPIVTNEEKWKPEAKKLLALPVWLDKAVQAAQPFHAWRLGDRYAAEVEQHPLVVMAALDNDDKHWNNLVGVATPESFESQLRPVFAEPSAVENSHRRFSYDTSLADGSVFLHEDTSPSLTVAVEGDLTWLADVSVEDRTGHNVHGLDLYRTAERAVTDACAMMFAAWESRLSGIGPFATSPGDSFRRRKSDGEGHG